MAPAENPAFWPLTLIVFLPALVAAGLSLPIIPKLVKRSLVEHLRDNRCRLPVVPVGCRATVFWCRRARPICCWTGRNAGGCETALD